MVMGLMIILKKSFQNNYHSKMKNIKIKHPLAILQKRN